MSENNYRVIAKIFNDYTSKFGIPRQSDLVSDLESRIVFEPEYRDPNALRGLEGYSHLWLIWEFSDNVGREWTPTVKPPRLGGNTRMGVFATRSPFRPNPFGLSSVRLLRIEDSSEGKVLIVSGADLKNETPILDIKPYLAYTDSHPEATGGFSKAVENYCLEVVFPQELLEILPERCRENVVKILSGDPRPGYQRTADRVYGMEFADYDIRFRVNANTLTVVEVVKLK